VAAHGAERTFGDVVVETGEDLVATVEVRRPPHNFFDRDLIASLADAYEWIDADKTCRAIVLCSGGKNFCAGMDFSAHVASGGERLPTGATDLYREAERLFAAATPVVAAVQGAAVGGGLGLACSADLRVASPQSRFVANFSRLGFHHGFALSVTLPPIVGAQRALEMLYTGRRVEGAEAAESGLCDRLAPLEALRSTARSLAADIAAAAPLAVRSIRRTMRGHLVEAVRTALAHEAAEQDRLRETRDWAEGVLATAERRPPRFEGR
jgi:enoyl-CoA hydratase/carnithine racemase